MAIPTTIIPQIGAKLNICLLGIKDLCASALLDERHKRLKFCLDGRVGQVDRFLLLG